MLLDEISEDLICLGDTLCSVKSEFQSWCDFFLYSWWLLTCPRFTLTLIGVVPVLVTGLIVAL